jgi:hypothetical protein
MLRDAARGRLPEPDGSVDVVPGTPEGARGALAMFTAHLVVAADVDPGDVHLRVAPGDFASWAAPEFFSWFGTRVGGEPGTFDMVLVAPGERRAPAAALSPAPPDFDHPRVRRASRYRRDVRVWTDRDRRAVLVVGRGLAGRLRESPGSHRSRRRTRRRCAHCSRPASGRSGRSSCSRPAEPFGLARTRSRCRRRSIQAVYARSMNLDVTSSPFG